MAFVLRSTVLIVLAYTISLFSCLLNRTLRTLHTMEGSQIKENYKGSVLWEKVRKRCTKMEE